MSEATSSVTNHSSGRRVALNSVLNLVTGIAIIVLNLLFVPALIRSFGTELFSVLSVTWMVLANLAWLDLGFSRAAARFVAQELAADRPDRAAMWSWTAVLTQFVIGSAGALVLFALAPRLTLLLHIDPQRQALVTLALRLFAFSVPLDLATRSLSGVLQARQRFGWLNALNVGATLWTFAVYGAGIYRGGDFSTVIVGLFALRVINLAATAAGAAYVLPTLRHPPRITELVRSYRSNAKTMVTFGWWVSIASLIGALLLYFDQWMIGFIVGAIALPFYSVPVGMLGRLAIFSSSVTSTLFPAFSALHRNNDWAQIEQFFIRSHRYIIAIVTPVIFLTFVWGGEFLKLWISPAFATEATMPLRILSAGMMIALLAPISGSLLEAMGRPQTIAKLYMIELPVNVALVYLLTRLSGVNGAAWSFTIRAVGETGALWVLLHRQVPFDVRALLDRKIVLQSVLVLFVALAALMLANASIRNVWSFVGTGVVLAIYAVVSLYGVLAEERGMILAQLGAKLRSRIDRFHKSASA